MKEAAGEANMTVVTIILIGIVAAVGGVIINNVMTDVNTNADNMNHGCATGQYWNGTQCVAPSRPN